MPHFPALFTLVFAKALFVPLLVLPLLAAEWFWFWRPYASGRVIGNWGLGLLNTLILWLLPFAALVGPAQWAATHGWGLFNHLAWPAWLEGLLAFLALDCAVYAQHRVLHLVPALWRLHRVHHTDTAVDVSTGLRFHPLEALISALFKTACVLALGASVTAAGAFAIALTAGSLFSHTNLRIAPRLQRVLKMLLVTPAMHRIHHSVDPAELQTNFGFFLPWWDWLFGSYSAAAKRGEGLQLGQPTQRAPADQQLLALLVQPFAPLARKAESNNL